MGEESTHVTAHELAQRLGVSLRRFYRTRDRLHVIEGFPRPLMAGGRLMFHRASIDDYFARIKPLRRNTDCGTATLESDAGNR